MFVSPPHPTARKLVSRLAIAASAGAALLGVIGTSPALAAEGSSSCQGQVFTQPFQLFGDSNYYTLVPGSQFNASEEGWELSGGARITEANRPYGLRGGVLELPSGARAVSPPMCVTLLYPTARMWARRVEGTGGVVRVGVSYAGVRPEMVEAVRGSRTAWTLSEPFEVRPQLGGEGEETREVRFILTARGDNNPTYDVYSLYVDPRML